jgi:hypothetical protein
MVTKHKMELCSACHRGAIMSVNWCLVGKELQFTSGIVMKANQLHRLTTHIRYFQFRSAPLEEWWHSEQRQMKCLYILSRDRIKYNL